MADVPLSPLDGYTGMLMEKESEGIGSVNF